MTLNGVGEPAPTRLQAAVQALKIELYTQWQTYRNGVHMDSDTFESIDFETLALAAIMGAGISVADVDLNTPPTTWVRKVGKPDTGRGHKPAPLVQEIVNELNKPTPYGLSADAIAEHGKQVQG